jgi:hypothetical protein
MMIRDQNGDAALLGQPAKPLIGLLLVAQIQAGNGLVEQEDRSLLGQRAGEKDPLALPTAQGSNVAPPQSKEVHRREGLFGCCHVASSQRRQWTDPGVAPQGNRLLNRHGELHFSKLRDQGHAACHLPPRERRERRPEQADLAGSLAVNPAERVKEGSLPAPIGTDQGRQGAALQGKADTPDHLALTVAGREIPRAQGRRVGCLFL